MYVTAAVKNSAVASSAVLFTAWKRSRFLPIESLKPASLFGEHYLVMASILDKNGSFQRGSTANFWRGTVSITQKTQTDK